ncbi:family with sequence similarity 60, member A [Nesidiocoris tenuis]|uniref:Family with sequence similarity 60, member A n=1 Tax=Nesidiocoris tenuis TaxID=355587 RepID=A0ABN7BGF4_9HEMI|nr:family with sequence similarity 60, member A [Nesidiocoris tenuis]
MFSFHKPKVYRSTQGCCICKAKSSSSRFTDSKKYEDDFVDCFQLPEKRCGEVCNACVLLVKRWKKLPEGNGRNWRHVVDARAKSFTKVKPRSHVRPSLKRKSVDDDNDEPIRKRKPKISYRHPDYEQDAEEIADGSRSPTPSDEGEEPILSGFIDLDIWRMEKICCGTVFVGPGKSVIIDRRLLVPCEKRMRGGKCGTVIAPGNPSKAIVAGAKTGQFSDNSSDSGYDESSNSSADALRVPN